MQALDLHLVSSKNRIDATGERLFVIEDSISDLADPGSRWNAASGSLDIMPPLPHPLQFVLIALAGWMNQQQRDVIDYL